MPGCVVSAHPGIDKMDNKKFIPKFGMSYELALQYPVRFRVRGIVDNQFVIREWCSARKRWIYEVVDQYWFDIRQSMIIKPKRSRL